MKRNILLCADRGKRAIGDGRNTLKLDDLRVLAAAARADVPEDAIYNAVILAFYAGVDVGAKMAYRAAEQKGGNA